MMSPAITIVTPRRLPRDLAQAASYLVLAGLPDAFSFKGMTPVMNKRSSAYGVRIMIGRREESRNNFTLGEHVWTNELFVTLYTPVEAVGTGWIGMNVAGRYDGVGRSMDTLCSPVILRNGLILLLGSAAR
jgi:hypothetical protein